MDVKGYWEGRARDGSWSTRRLYEGPITANNYNFITRRDCVRELLASDGRLNRVLDIGCGTADYFTIASLHHASYHGVDFSPQMVREAAARLEGHGKRHLVSTASGTHLPYRDRCFDLVLAVGYIEYFPDPIPAIQEITRVLAPGGLLVMQSFKPDLFGTLDRLTDRLRRAWRRWRHGRPGGGGGLRAVLYSRRGLDGLLAPFGFVPTNHRFNNFWVLPRFLLVKYPQVYIRLSELLNRLNVRWCSVLAVNYICRYAYSPTARSEEKVPWRPSPS